MCLRVGSDNNSTVHISRLPYGYNFNGRRNTSGRYEPGETVFLA